MQRFLSTLILASSAVYYADAQQLSPIPVDSLRRGSTDIVTEQRMNKGIVKNALDALSGQAAGVNIAASNANPMAMLYSVRVRGTTSLMGGNDPLVIIDGVNADLATLSSIYPGDIESFSILKNAAETAQYGSRGASGVIEVKTKRGQAGRFQISYDGSIGVEKAFRFVDMLTAEDYVATAKRLGVTYNNGGENTDFQRELTRTGWVQNHHLAFSSGTEQSHYRASLAVMDHRTVLRPVGQTHYMAKLDLTQWAFHNILFVEIGAFGASGTNKRFFDEQKLFYSAATMNPTLPFNPSTTGGWSKNTTASQINPPGALLHELNDERQQNFNTHLKLDWNLMRLFSLQGKGNWHLKLLGSYTYSHTDLSTFAPTWVWAQGQALRGSTRQGDWLVNATMSYSNEWGNHHLDAMFLTEYQSSIRDGFSTLVKGFTNNAVEYYNLGAAALRPYGGNQSNYTDPKLASVMGSLSYTFRNRYTLSTSLRADGSNQVGKQHTWGVFPSVAVSYDVYKDLQPLLSPSSALSMLRLRSSWGLTGNLDAITSFRSMDLLSPTGIVNVSGAPTVTMGMTRNTNPDLMWETRATWNVGADVGLLHNRLVFTAEYYNSLTRNMLYDYDVPTPPYPFSKMLANIGSMSNNGWELGVSFVPLRQRDLELNINVNMAWQQNRLRSLSGMYNGTAMSAARFTPMGSLNGAGFHGGNNKIVYQIVGQPLGVFYLPHATGLEKLPNGTYRYAIADLDHNGKINIEDGGDRYIAGQATPKWTMGSNISLRLYQWDLSLQLNGAFGHKIYNGTALTYMNMASFPDYNVMKDAPASQIMDQTATDYWLERGDYVNIDYITVGWNVPLKSRLVQSLRMALSVNNLATITAYKGITPLINSYIAGATLGIDDKRSFPAYRSYALSLSVTF